MNTNPKTLSQGFQNANIRLVHIMHQIVGLEKVNKYLTQVRTLPQLRLHALEEIFALADNDSDKEPLCDQPPNLLPILRDLLYENIGQMEVCDPVIRILWFLSRNLVCCVIISSSKLGILSVLIKILTEVANIRVSNYFEGIMNVFTNMSLTADCQYELISSELGFVSYLRSYILAYHHDLRAIAILSNDCSCAALYQCDEYSNGSAGSRWC